jgi:hypothetical protein
MLLKGTVDVDKRDVCYVDLSLCVVVGARKV